MKEIFIWEWSLQDDCDMYDNGTCLKTSKTELLSKNKSSKLNNNIPVK
jgi:hypothetical protein